MCGENGIAILRYMSKEFPRIESPFRTPEKPVTHSEDKHLLLEAQILQLLEQYAVKANEGMNGYIMRLPSDAIPAHVLLQLREQGFDLPEQDQAMKILKIYSAGEGRYEADMQKKARTILQEHGANKEQYAQVPQVFFTKDIPVTNSSRHRFQELGVALGSDHAEVIGMEFVEGDDLATGLYREVLKRKVQEHGEAFLGLPYSVERMNVRELQEYVSRILDFRRPGGKAVTEAERQHEQRLVNTENTTKLTNYLRRSGFVLDPRIVTQIKNTLELLHEHHFAHRDAHHRNIMVRGSLAKQPNSSEAPQTFLIDFGTATTFEGSYQESAKDLYQDVSTTKGRMNFVDDMLIISQLEELTKSKEQESDERALRYLADLRREFLTRKNSNNPLWKAILIRFENAAKEGYFSPQSVYDAVPERPDRIDNFLCVLLHFKEADYDIRPDAVRTILNRLQTQPITNQNRLNYFRQLVLS